MGVDLMASGVYVYNYDDVDITTTGLVGDLQPAECIFTEEKNGESGLTMRLCYDSLGKWKAVKPGCYIKAKVPVRVPPRIISNKYNTTLYTYTVKQTVSQEITVYQSTGYVIMTSAGPALGGIKDNRKEVPVKIKKYLHPGDEVQLLLRDGEKAKVYSPKFGTGWIFTENLTSQKTDTITGTIDGVENVADAVRLQYQLFLVNSVEQTLDGVTVNALHVFYELLPNFTTWKTDHAVEAPTAIKGVFDNLLVQDVRFTCLTDTSDTAGGALDYERMNVVQALLDPENGICARYGLSLIRDNYDLYALKNVGSDRGFVVEYSKNMLAVEHSEDISNVVTRIVPFGLDANGNAVYLDEMYVDSPHIDDYTAPRVQYLDCTDTAVECKEKGKEKTLAQVKAELKERAEAEFAGGCDLPELSMTVSFIALGDTEEYKQYRDLDKVYLFDKIGIRDKVRGYDYSAEVVAITHNVLTGRLESVTLGSIRQGTGVRKIATWQVPAVDGSNIRLKSIHAGALGDGSIPESALQDGAVTVDKLAAGAVTADKIAAGAITTDFLEAGSIKTEHLEAGAVTADKIATGALTAISVEAGSITTDKLAAGAVTADKIAAGVLTAIAVEAESITTEKLAAEAVTAEKIKAGTITAEQIKSKTITADQVAAGLITADNGLIEDSAIGTAQIADGSITDAKIVGLTASKITAGTINAANVNINNLNADNITTGTINGKRIPVLGTDKIADGAVSGVKIVDGAVTTDKIDDEAVTAAKVVASAITAEKIASNAVTANKILAGAVTTDKLDANAVTADKIDANAVTADKIDANAVTADKIKAGAVTANKLASDVGKSLDLSSNESINTIVKDATDALPTTFVQYDTPGKKKAGDIWINTGGALWSGLAKGTWQDAGASQWGDHYNRKHKTRVWNGQKWETVADQAVVIDQETRIRQTEESLKLTATKTELNDKVSRTEYEQDAEAISMRVQTVEAQSGKAQTVTNAALTLDENGIDMKGGQVNIRAGSAMHIEAGSAFTVDAPNFNLDEKGTVNMSNASVNGELLNSGQPVLTAKNLVVSSTTPKNPIVGTVWVKPVGAVVASFVYNNTAVQSFEKMESAHTLQNLGSPTTAGGTFTWNASIPYKVTDNVTAERYLRMTVNGTVLFDVALACNAGTYTLQQNGTLPSWLGNAETLSFTLELHFLEGSESYLHNVHRLNTGAVELKLTAATDAAQGWMATEIQVYNG